MRRKTLTPSENRASRLVKIAKRNFNWQIQINKTSISMDPSAAAPAATLVDNRAKFAAPIKPEYLVKLAPLLPEPKVTNEENGAGPSDATQDNAARVKHGRDRDDEGQGSGKRGRGPSKGFGQRKVRVERDIGSELCNSIIFSMPCPRGTSCKYSHDVKDFLSKKPADLGNKCPAFEAYGRCPVGVKCRFAGAHTNMETGEQSEVAGKDPQNVQIMNLNLIGLQRDIRKNVYPLKKSTEISAALAAERGEKKAQASDPNVPKPGGAAAIAAAAAAAAARAQAAAAASTGSTDEKSDDIDVREGRLRPQEKKRIDFRGKTYLAPLTTVGNLPFRRLCKKFGADVTCSEMTVALKLVQNDKNEFALLKRHQDEDLFGVQICGNNSDVMAKVAEMLSAESYGVSLDFIDINLGCPIDMVFNSGAGSALLDRTTRLSEVVRSVDYASIYPTTCKIRTGVLSSRRVAHMLVPLFDKWNAQLLTLHGRSREMRYSKLADWDYVAQCSAARPAGSKMAFFGNGDILSHEDYYADLEKGHVDGAMVARGALYKPWIFTEIKERRVWDISSRERLDMMTDYARYGLENWGSDDHGIATTRRFLLECCSFFHRYIPAGLLEVLPQKIADRAPRFFGRDELETLMASPNKDDWIKLVERIPLLGKTPEGFQWVWNQVRFAIVQTDFVFF